MNNKKSKKIIKYIIGFLILILLMALTYYVIFNKFDINETLRQITDSSHKHYLFISGLMSVFYLGFYGRFCRIGINASGEKTNSIKCFIYGCTDYFYSVITPSSSGGQPAVIYFMAKDGIPYPTAGVIVILQAIFFKVILLFYNLLSIIYIPDIIANTGNLIKIMLIISASLAIVAIVLCILSMYRTRLVSKIGAFSLKILGKLKLIRNTDSKIEAFVKVLEDYKSTAAYLKGKRLMLVRMFFVTFLQRSSMFLIAYFVYKSFGFGEFNFLVFLCIQALIELAIQTVPIPGFIGISEYTIFLLNSSIYGSDKILALASMLLIRGFSYYLPFIISSIFVLAKHITVYFANKRITLNN